MEPWLGLQSPAVLPLILSTCSVDIGSEGMEKDMQKRRKAISRMKEIKGWKVDDDEITGVSSGKGSSDYSCASSNNASAGPGLLMLFRPGVASRGTVPLQFGSISPGIINVMQPAAVAELAVARRRAPRYLQARSGAPRHLQIVSALSCRGITELFPIQVVLGLRTDIADHKAEDGFWSSSGPCIPALP